MKTLSRFARDARGVAAVEFIMVATVLIMLCFGGFDFGRFVVSAQRVEAVSYNLSQMLSQTPVSSAAVDNGDGVVSDATIAWYENSAMVIFPEALADSFAQQTPWTTILSVNMTSLKFVPNSTTCGSSCTYTPKVVWTTGNRPCNTTFIKVADANPASPTTLPTDIYGPSPEIVVDVTYTFKPTVGATWLPTMTMSRTTYMAPRNVAVVESSAGSKLAPNCSGVL
jgi:hypothetical protein